MNSEKAIEVLNTLIVINNDRVEGYETASKETEEDDLKTLFSQLATTSHDCNEELREEVENLDGEAAEGTRATGKFFRVWMDVKAALTGKDRKAILNSCEYGEDVAQETYSKVLKNDYEHLTSDQVELITAQQHKLKIDHDTVKSLRDSLVEVE
jgi:uncharacterized protein (TIGR02284 family)